MKCCELALQIGNDKGFGEALAVLHQSCKDAGGKDDLTKGAELLEIYALKCRMAISKQSDSRVYQDLYEKTKNLTAAVTDPKTMSVIKECWGLMFGYQGDWTRAYTEFFTAFDAYQEIPIRDKAKQCIKYMVIANMLGGGAHNPFDARETQVYAQEPEVMVIGQLREAHERHDIIGFNQALEAILKAEDVFINKNLHGMIRDFQAKTMLSLVKPYSRVHIISLAKVGFLRVSKCGC